MIPVRTQLLLFIPAIFLVGIALFVRYTQYDPLYPDPEEIAAITEEQQSFQIPILPGDPVIGNKQAPLTIVAFEDFACEACKHQSTVLKNLQQKHPDRVKVIWKGLPVTTFPHDSQYAHEVAFCMKEQGYFEDFSQRAFANNLNLSEDVVNAFVAQMDQVSVKRLEACKESGRGATHVEKTEQIARALQIQSVPTMFMNSRQIQAPDDLSGWERLLAL